MAAASGSMSRFAAHSREMRTDKLLHIGSGAMEGALRALHCLQRRSDCPPTQSLQIAPLR